MNATRAASGYPLPTSPEALLRVARLLDRFWVEVDPEGSLKPTLDEELALWADL